MHNKIRLTITGETKFLTNPLDVYIGKSIELYGEWSYGEIDLLKQITSPSENIIEVGANIGAHTVFIARDVFYEGVVYAFEPRRLFFQTLCGNIALNSLKNVYAFQKAVGSVHATILEGNISSTEVTNQGGYSLGSIAGNSEIIEIVPLDSMIDFIKKIGLIKADVEGFEEHVSRGASALISRDRPLLYLENDRVDSSPSLIGYVTELGYDLYWHIVPLYREKNFANTAVNIFGNTVSVNMLGVPAERSLEVKGIPRIQSADEHPLKRYSSQSK